MNDLKEQKKELVTLIHKDFQRKSPEEIKKAVVDYEKRYETTSLNKDQEKKLL